MNDADVAASHTLDRPVDVLWVTTKATGLQDSLARAPASLVADATVVPLLNGLDHVSLLRQTYRRVSAAAIAVETERTAPGQIRQVSPFLRVELAPATSSAESTVTADGIAAVLTAAGISTTVRDDELGVLWDKFALLAPIALATTALNGPLGDVRHDPRFRACQDEVLGLAALEGASTDPAAVLALVAAAPASMRSSMQKDLDRGMSPELDAIAGAITRRAARHRHPVPATNELTQMIGDRISHTHS